MLNQISRRINQWSECILYTRRHNRYAEHYILCKFYIDVLLFWLDYDNNILGNKPCCFYFVVHDKFTPIRQNIKITKMKWWSEWHWSSHYNLMFCFKILWCRHLGLSFLTHTTHLINAADIAHTPTAIAFPDSGILLQQFIASIQRRLRAGTAKALAWHPSTLDHCFSWASPG